MPLLARMTLQKYSPSLSFKRRTSHGPAASVSSRLTSQVAVCMCRFSPIFRRSHSAGERSHHKELRQNLVRAVRYAKYPHSDENSVRVLRHSFEASICLPTLLGESRSSASSH